MAPPGLDRKPLLVAFHVGAAAAVAGLLFWLAYTNGGYGVTTRGYAAIAVWWLLGIGAAVGLASRSRPLPRLAAVSVSLLAAFALWTLLSVRWASDAELAFQSFALVALYVGVLAVGVLLVRYLPVETAVVALALGVVSVALVALVSRLFPSSFGAAPGAALLPGVSVRLSFPLGYWNGLGIESALAYPLLLAVMVSERAPYARSIAAGALPALAAVVYLTSSRGAVATALVAVVAFLLLAPRRWPALAATVVAAGASVVAVATLYRRHDLVDGPLGTPLAAHEGHHAALALALTGLGSAAAWFALSVLGRRVHSPPRVVGWVLAGLLCLAVLVGVASAHPAARFHAFRTPAGTGGSANFVRSHLLSSSGSGRWQFWQAAMSEFRAHPLNGGGAGSYEAWWAQHGSLPLFVVNAHSLYLETLAELGVVGFVLLGVGLLCAVVGAVLASRRTRVPAVAGAAACGIGFCAAAGIDWVWQLSAVGVVGLAALGLALGSLDSPKERRGPRADLVRGGFALVAVAIVAAEFILLATGLHLSASRNAAARNDLTGATTEALEAKSLEPWAASPYTQLALIAERRGDLRAASALIRSAIARSPRDWRLWLISTRLETRQGHIDAALADLARARALNPRSPIFAAGS